MSKDIVDKGPGLMKGIFGLRFSEKVQFCVCLACILSS